MNPQTILDYVHKNTVNAKLGRKCVDGRYLPDDENAGMISRPGADFGYVMTLMAYSNEQKLNLNALDCAKKVYEVVMSLDSTFYMHTDSHENKSVPYSIGCGHAAKACTDEFANRYELHAEDVKKALEYFKNAREMNVKIVPLTGEHKEKGVLIVNSDEYSLNSQHENDMYFIYDKKRDDEFLKNLVEKLNMENVLYEDFQRISTTQLTVTLQLLAKDLPIFEVNFTDLSEPTVEFKGSV